MISGLDWQLLLALAIVLIGVALFATHLISSTRRAGLFLSESRVPRRYFLLGLVAGLGLLYMTRR